MYILIFEDSTIGYKYNLELADYADAVNDGLLDVIRIDDRGTIPKYFDGEKWVELKHV